jgi:hypothetical protein
VSAVRLPFFKEGIHALFLIDTAKKRDEGLAFGIASN